MPLGDLPGVPWMPALTTLCLQADAMEGSLMGFPGERGPPGLKGVKVRVQEKGAGQRWSQNLSSLRRDDVIIASCDGLGEWASQTAACGSDGISFLLPAG